MRTCRLWLALAEPVVACSHAQPTLRGRLPNANANTRSTHTSGSLSRQVYAARVRRRRWQQTPESVALNGRVQGGDDAG